MSCNVIFRCQGKAPVTWQTTWRSRWTTLTPSPCRSRASLRRNVGRTCTSCSTSTPSSPIPLGFWRKAPQRTACQVGISFQQPASSSSQTAFLLILHFYLLCCPPTYIFFLLLCIFYFSSSICTLCSVDLTSLLSCICLFFYSYCIT